MTDQDLIDAIIARLSEIDGVQAVFEETENLAAIQTPAIILQVERIDPGDNPGNGQLCPRLDLVAFAAVNRSDGLADRQARQLALRILSVVNRARGFDVPGVMPAQLSGADRDPFDVIGAADDARIAAVWAARWSHRIAIGDDVWHSDAVVPTELIINEHAGGV